MGKRTGIVSFLILGFCFFVDKFEIPWVIKAILSATFLVITSLVWAREYHTVGLKSKAKGRKNFQTFWYLFLIGILTLVITGITAGRELRPLLEPFLGVQPENDGYYWFFLFSVFLPEIAIAYVISSCIEKAKF